MQVIGAGLPRTGTLSQKIALEMLGFGPCYHMVNVLADLDLAQQWRRAIAGETDWEKTFAGFEATVDWPGSFFYKELIDVYPDAKVVLGVRDGESWARSMHETIWGVFYGHGLVRHLSAARGIVDPRWRGYMDMMMEMWDRSGLMESENKSAEDMSGAMERYQDEVRETVPADRLLVWSVQEGWEPLCAFLEVDVPDAPFPRTNDSAEFADRLIDGSLQTLQAWREQDKSGEAAAQ
jgi:Sulfotransferase domain